MSLPMFGQKIGKFSLNQMATLNRKFTIANFFIILIRPSIRLQRLSYESFGSLFYMLKGDYKAFFAHLFCSVFPRIPCGNAPLKHCFAFLYQKNSYFSLYYLFVKKNLFSFDKSKLFLINSIAFVLSVINHIDILPLNNHLFNNRDIIKTFDIT